MTKKDYELIASVFEYYAYDNDSFNPLIHKMADTLASKNPRFNKEKFLKACGVLEQCRKCEEYHNDGIYHICPDNQ